MAPGLCKTILLQSIKYLTKISYLERFRYRLFGSQLATICYLLGSRRLGMGKRANTDDDGVNDNRGISSYFFLECQTNRECLLSF